MASLPNPQNTDGRKLGDWTSRYNKVVQKAIKIEAWYLASIFIAAPIIALILSSGILFKISWMDLDKARYRTFACYALVALGGTFGGTLFDIKWLIHAVAKGRWHLDRKLWRYLVPLTSGGFALIFSFLISSNLITIFNPNALNSYAASFGFGFLVGYFSDNAIAKLSEVAQTLFGTLEEKSKSELVQPNNQQPPNTTQSRD